LERAKGIEPSYAAWELHHSQVDQEDSCKTGAIELQSDQRVTRAAQNIADRAPRPKPIYHSVYIGRERLGRYVQTGPKKIQSVRCERPAVRKLPRPREGVGGYRKGAEGSAMSAFSVSAELVNWISERATQVSDQPPSAYGQQLRVVINAACDVNQLD
jgi:hypothetical protein